MIGLKLSLKIPFLNIHLRISFCKAGEMITYQTPEIEVYSDITIIHVLKAWRKLYCISFGIAALECLLILPTSFHVLSPPVSKNVL